MAGAGYKSWVDGDILTAADVNTYLMQQSVMRFADAAARTSAIAAPSEGMVTYLVDTDAIEYYDGAAWQPILDQDVIESKGDLIVGTADDTVSRLAVGTNEHRLIADSGESTGLKYVADTTNYAIGAKGDLLVGTAADTVSNLAVGTDGYILTADSGETTGLKWIQLAAGTPTSASAFVSTEETTTSTSYTDLATSGPAVTLTTGTKALVIIKARIFANTTGQSAYMSTAISGASSVSAADEYSLAQMSADTQNPRLNVASAHVYTGLTAGSNTFTAKYKTTNASSAAYFRWREIIVIDLGS